MLLLAAEAGAAFLAGAVFLAVDFFAGALFFAGAAFLADSLSSPSELDAAFFAAPDPPEFEFDSVSAPEDGAGAHGPVEGS
ncbi:hypothetical protein E1212_24510 [Jiangella ureilytica]|uniref:Uncharacterized protein n=1 Tax=Jiangella ureilytica TaxID=2530374 RepID=A0A4R4RG08_9ACTN|nr:hypothetical protein E1212_24510 [Jiangella ureilytica]